MFLGNNGWRVEISGFWNLPNIMDVRLKRSKRQRNGKNEANFGNLSAADDPVSLRWFVRRKRFSAIVAATAAVTTTAATATPAYDGPGVPTAEPGKFWRD